MIDIICPQCASIYHSEETHAGKHLRCVKCGYLVSISPTSRPVAVESSSASPETPRRQANPPSASYPTQRIRRIYTYAIAVGVIAIAGVSLVAWEHHNPSVNAQPRDIEKQTRSQRNKAPDRPLDFVVEEPDATPAPKAVATQHEAKQRVEPRPTNYNSLPTGTRITEDIGPDGHGQLMVDNGTTEDAVVRLYDAATYQTVRWFFVQAGNSINMNSIPQGTYKLAYTTGLDWIESQDVFRWHPFYSEFERTLEYTEQKDDEGGVRYHDMSVTLNAVHGGNIRTKGITREKFLKGHRHIALQN